MCIRDSHQLFRLPICHHISPQSHLCLLYTSLAEDKAFYLVVIREALVSPCGVEDPVADIDQVQQAPKLLVGKFQSHPQDLLLLEAQMCIRDRYVENAGY